MTPSTPPTMRGRARPPTNDYGETDLRLPAADAFPAMAGRREAAIAAGGKDNGAPGLRPHYHPNYCGAFILDPDGNNVEAVCHKPG